MFDPTVCLPSRLASCQPLAIMSLAPTMTSSTRATSNAQWLIPFLSGRWQSSIVWWSVSPGARMNTPTLATRSVGTKPSRLV